MRLFHASAAGVIALASTSAVTAEECKVEDWRFFQVFGTDIQIEGRTTCREGIINLSAYTEDGEYLGNGMAFLQGHNFAIHIPNAEIPDGMRIKYDITQ